MGFSRLTLIAGTIAGEHFMNDLLTSATRVLDAILRAVLPLKDGNRPDLTAADELDRATCEYEARVCPMRARLLDVSRGEVDGRTVSSAHDDLVTHARAICTAIRNWPEGADPQAAKVWAAGRRLYVAKVRPELVFEAERATHLEAVTPPPPPEVPTVWSHGDRTYSRDGRNPYVVTAEEDYVLQAFLQRGTAMDTRDLETASGVTNIPRVIGRLIEGYQGQFAAAIRTPNGKKNAGGYFVRVRSVT